MFNILVHANSLSINILVHASVTLLGGESSLFLWQQRSLPRCLVIFIVVKRH